MKKKFFKILTIVFINLTLIGVCVFNVKADWMGFMLSLTSVAQEIVNGDVNSLVDFIEATFTASGFLPGSNSFKNLSTLDQYVQENYPELEGNDENETAENVTDYLGTNISVSDNSVHLNSNSQAFINNYINYIKGTDNNEVYSYHITELSQRFSYSDVYNAAIAFIDGNNVEAGDLYFINNAGLSTQIWHISSNTTNFNWFYALKVNVQSSLTNSVVFNLYDNSNGSPVTITGYQYNQSSRSFTQSNSTLVSSINGVVVSDYNYNVTSGTKFFVSDNAHRSILRLYDTAPNTNSISNSPYYYNNSVYNDFSSSNDGYTFSPTNINTVTYGDVSDYVNSFNTENGYPPTLPEINNYIENTNNNNINNSGGGSGGSGDDSGGGSGGSGDDSGGGSGGSGDDSGGGSGIVSILTALGKAIADLITGIAAFLAEVVGGLVEAITGLLDTLTGLITNFTESIPNIFSPLLGWLFDGLPEEFTAIILLGLTACVIASIIKILRG